MKFAVCCLKGRVSPLVKYTREIAVVSVSRRGRPIIKKVPTVSLKPSVLVDLLKDMNVTLLICGGIKEEWQQILRNNNIAFIENIIGDLNDVVKVYMEGKLHADVVIS